MNHPLVLASASPRRKELLEMVGIPIEVIPSNYEEPSHSDHLTEPLVFAEEVAIGKGKEVFERYERKRTVLSADTIGILGDIVLEKPKDRDDAKRMLLLMSGKMHVVLTVLALFTPNNTDPIVEKVETKVFFRELNEEEIEEYLDSEQYMDKAAAYAIQGKAAVFVERIEGDFFNVVGLPLSKTWELLEKNKGQ